MQQSLGNAANPAFLAYVLTCLVLSLNLLMLWVSSGAIRAQGGIFGWTTDSGQVLTALNQDGKLDASRA